MYTNLYTIYIDLGEPSILLINSDGERSAFVFQIALNPTNYFALQEIKFNSLQLIFSKIGGIYALIAPFFAYLLSFDQAFVKDLIR